MVESLSDERIDANVHKNRYKYWCVVIRDNHKTKQIRCHKCNRLLVLRVVVVVIILNRAWT